MNISVTSRDDRYRSLISSAIGKLKDRHETPLAEESSPKQMQSKRGKIEVAVHRGISIDCVSSKKSLDRRHNELGKVDRTKEELISNAPHSSPASFVAEEERTRLRFCA